MPAAEQILDAATLLANQWLWLAVGWHIALGALGAAFMLGWRPSERVLACLLMLPLASVGVLAWASGNPFTGLMFSLLTAAALRAAMELPTRPVQFASVWPLAAGVVLAAVGVLYPHFVEGDTPWIYLYGSPFGLLPCPTLLVVTGLALVFGRFNSAAWSEAVMAADILYGLMGVVVLGVTLDLALLAGAILLFITTASPASRISIAARHLPYPATRRR